MHGAPPMGDKAQGPTSRLCVTIADSSLDRMRARAAGLSCVELRLDALDDPDPEGVASLVRACPTVLLSMRPCTAILESLRERVLKAAIETGAAYLDVELDMPAGLRSRLTATARDCGTRLVVSHHAPAACPPLGELRARLAQARALGPSFVKIACRVTTEEESRRLLSLMKYGPDVIPVGLGAMALSTSRAALRAGVAWTYATDAIGAAQGCEHPEITTFSAEQDPF